MTLNLPAGSPAVLRSLNRTRILGNVRARHAISRVEISRETGLSKPTVNEIVAGLLSAGLLREVEPDAAARRARPGPRPKLIAFRPEFGYVLGVDIGGNKLLAFLADLSGTVVRGARRSAAGPRRAGTLLRELERMLRSLLDEAAVKPEDIKGICVGTPGVVDPLTQRVSLAPQIQGWDDVDIGGAIRGWLPTRVSIESEVGLAMLAERSLGAGRGIDDLVYLSVGIGIGAGILMGGERYRGATGAAGEIGYLPLFEDAAAGDADGFGSFELAAGGGAYARLGSAAARRRDGAVLRELAGGDPGAVDAEVVFRAAAAGDAAALKIIDELAGRLARGIAAAATLLDPSTVIIGGGVSRAGDLLMRPVEAHLRGLLPRAPRLVVSTLGEDAVALGAVAAAIRDWESNTYAMFAAENL